MCSSPSLDPGAYTKTLRVSFRWEHVVSETKMSESIAVASEAAPSSPSNGAILVLLRPGIGHLANTHTAPPTDADIVDDEMKLEICGKMKWMKKGYVSLPPLQFCLQLSHHVVSSHLSFHIGHWARKMLLSASAMSAREITNIKSMSSVTIFILYDTKDSILASHRSYESACQLEHVVRTFIQISISGLRRKILLMYSSLS